MKIATDRAPQPAASLLARVWRRCLGLVRTGDTPNSHPQRPDTDSGALGSQAASGSRPGRWPDLQSKLPRHKAVVLPVIAPNGEHEQGGSEVANNTPP